jgi:hypothetical protein
VASVIPQTFRRIWFGPRDMPARYEAYGRTWVDHHPNWWLVDHGYGLLPPMVNQAAFDDVLGRDIVNPGGAKGDTVRQVQQADIASYELLWALGGVYLNCDMECIRPIGELLDGATCVIAWEQDDEYPSNAFMAATPEHPFIGLVLRLLPGRLERFAHNPINEQTGPHLLREAWREYGGNDVRMVPSRFLMPFDFNHTDEAAADHHDAYALHHWGHRIPDEELWT